MESIPLNALRAFALVVRHGGVRAAARELAVSHSAVSRHLSELERWLGVPLTEPGEGQRGIVVTPQGERLAAVVLASLQDMGQAVDAVRERRSPHAVTISTTPSFAARWLLPRLPALERAHPQLEISVVVDQRVDDPGTRSSDLAIRSGDGDWPGMDAQPLMDDRLYPVASHGYWEAAGCPADPAELARLRLLHDRDAAASWQLWRQVFGPADLDVRPGPRLASTDLVLRAAAQGMGVALARHRLVGDELAAGTLVRPFGERQIVLERAYWLVTPAGRGLRHATRTLIGWLRREAALQA